MTAIYEITKSEVTYADTARPVYRVTVYVGDYPLYATLDYKTLTFGVQDQIGCEAKTFTEYPPEVYAEVLTAAHAAMCAHDAALRL